MVKLWSIPVDGLTEDLTAPMVSINTSEWASDIESRETTVSLNMNT